MVTSRGLTVMRVVSCSCFCRAAGSGVSVLHPTVEHHTLLYPPPAACLPSYAADPLYFDFISFSQYSTISREMERPLSVFSEYKEVCPPGAGEDDPCEAGTQVVRRPPQFADDAQLPQYFFNTAGEIRLGFFTTPTVFYLTMLLRGHPVIGFTQCVVISETEAVLVLL